MVRLLITGGAGFIGHHLVDRVLRKTDWQITVLDRLDHSGNLNRLAEIGAARSTRVRFVFHDLRAPMNAQVMQQIGYHDHIVHMAAGTHVDRSIDDPMAFVMDNVVGTCTILDFARTMGCKRFLYFSTDEVFGPAPIGTFYHEDDRYRSGNPYAATKAGGEELAMAYQNTYGLPVIVTHTMNAVGERQNPEKFIPNTIAKIRDGETVLVHADKTKTKPGARYYIDAKEIARAVLMLLDRGEPGVKYNICGTVEMDNLKMAQSIGEAMGKPFRHELIDFHSSRPGHDLRYALDASRMERMGFMADQPGIDRIVKWYLANPHWLPAPAASRAAA